MANIYRNNYDENEEKNPTEFYSMEAIFDSSQRNSVK